MDNLSKLKVVADKRTFNMEPEQTDKDWMIVIYSDEINSMGMAGFFHLFQYLLLSCLKVLGRCENVCQKRLDQDIEADIEHLSRYYEKDLTTIWTLVVLFIFELKQQLAKSPTAFSNDTQMRGLIKKVFGELTTNFANTLGTYNQAMQAKSKEAERTELPPKLHKRNTERPTTQGNEREGSGRFDGLLARQKSCDYSATAGHFGRTEETRQSAEHIFLVGTDR
jgi:hypothetical protein